ncbi:unnamed protein product [Lupinus luteus]|uniref:Uncharacterized protein n=1 Tax=Lupinus luteus TaxID=3873 RepID=A0AAV1YFK7_LUPLU
MYCAIGLWSDIEEIEEEGQCGMSSLTESSQTIINECETMSQDLLGASSSCLEEEDNDDSLMQYITEEAWYSSNAAFDGGKEVSHVTFTTSNARTKWW